MNAVELAYELRKVIRFRFLTVDRYSVKLWNGTRPWFCKDGGFWAGEESCGFLDLGNVVPLAPLRYQESIVEVSR